MVNRVLQPQEIEVFYVLPALRRELAVCMKEFGKSQKEIAKLVGVTEAAISQYLSSKRATFLQFDSKVKLAIKNSAENITDELSLTRELQRLLILTRQERIVCKVHENLGTAQKGCNVCFEDLK